MLPITYKTIAFTPLHSARCCDTQMHTTPHQVRFRKNPLTKALDMHRVGQYYFVNFPALSMSEWHPFSVSRWAQRRLLICIMPPSTW